LDVVRARIRRHLPEPVVEAVRGARRGWWRVSGRLRGPVRDEPPRPEVPSTPVRLLVGPANFAGQAWAWARAAEQHLDGVGATVVAVRRGLLDFPADYPVPMPVYRSPSWSVAQRDWVVREFTHVLIDGVRPLLGPLYGNNCGRELDALSAAGLAVGLIAHGSDIRLPSRHRELYPRSPFDPDHPNTRGLQAQAERLGSVFLGFDGPTFVSTPDLLDFAPRATWLPVVVDEARWASEHPVLERPRPVVVHVPSNPFLKGSHLVDGPLQEMSDRGLIEYRRLEGVPPEQMPAVVADADIVLDQFVLGLYSVMAVQGMFAGRLVVAHVADRVRARVPGELPIVEAGPQDVVAVLERVLDDRDAARATAAAGLTYARQVHDGTLSARTLAPFLGRPGGTIGGPPDPPSADLSEAPA
jgi:hypothetical protein